METIKETTVRMFYNSGIDKNEDEIIDFINMAKKDDQEILVIKQATTVCFTEPETTYCEREQFFLTTVVFEHHKLKEKRK